MAIKGINLKGISLQEADTNYPTLSGDHMTRFTVAPKTVMYRGSDVNFRWLQMDDTYPEQMLLRARYVQLYQPMLIERLDQQTIDAKKIETSVEKIAEAEIELRDEVINYSLKTYPDYFRQDGNKIYSTITGITVNVEQADPMIACALLVTEDMLLMMPCEENTERNITTYRLASGALVFPNGWALNTRWVGETEEEMDEAYSAAKLSKSLYEIHNPKVKQYTENYTARADKGFHSLTPDIALTRSGWSPQMSDELLLHADLPAPYCPEYTTENWETDGVVRMEHQTLRKLPKTGAVVFTVKTYNWNVADILENDISRKALIEGYDNLSPQMREYRAHSLPSFGVMLDKYRNV